MLARLKKPRTPRRPQTDPAGRELVQVEAKGTFGRIRTALRAKRGDFEWMAARGHLTAAQDHAGRRCRALWEACGGREPSSPPLERQGRDGRYGPPEAVCEAIDENRRLMPHLGKLATDRLLSFLHDGLTVAEAAARWGYSAREMGILLRADLDAASMFYGFDDAY